MRLPNNRIRSVDAGPFGRAKPTRLVAGLLVGIVLSACATSPAPEGDSPADRPNPEPGIYRVASGERVPIEELARELSSTTYVVFGESHGRRWHHQRQARLFRRLAEDTETLALGMEMFQRPFQEPLDAYVDGAIAETEMLERTEWESRWGFSTEYYRPLWRTARRRNLPVVALNVRRELSKKIARVGLDGLSSAERSKLPSTIDTSIEAQRSYVRRAFESHGMSEHMSYEHFLEAQAAWDETMADTALAFVRSRPDVERMLVVAGRAHARSDFGIPARLRRRIPSPASVVSILPTSVERLGKENSTDSANPIRSAPADYLWVGEKSET